MNQTVYAIQSALKAKSPIVALPVEGHAPFCMRAKLLKGALKGVTITSAEVERIENQFLVELDGEYRNGSYQRREGPQQQKTSVHFSLRIRGTAGMVNGPSSIRTSCRFIPLSRHIALKELSAWNEKERVKLQKTRVLGTKTPATSERGKLARYITTHIDGEDAQTFHYRDHKKNVIAVQGLPVTFKSWPHVEFFIWASDRDELGAPSLWSITEKSSGMGTGGSHISALKALEDAEIKISKGNKDALLATIASLQISPAPQAVAA
jgi:hypothetical protein